MAEWYVSSVVWAAIPAYQQSHAYVIGDLVVSTTAVAKRRWVFRCTTAGTTGASEPTWTGTQGATFTNGTATFTNVTGASATGWTTAAGDFSTLQGESTGTVRAQGGDTVYVSSDHAESTAGSTQLGSGINTASYSLMKILSCNRAGSTPPVAADLLAGAVFTVTSNSLNIVAFCPVYIFGCTFSYTGTTTAAIGLGGSIGTKTAFLDACQLWLHTATTTCRIVGGNADANVVLNNTTLKFDNASQGVAANGVLTNLTWLNTASAIAGATIPTTLFNSSSVGGLMILTARGVDLSAITGTLFAYASGGGMGGYKVLLDSCKIAAAATRFSFSNLLDTRDEIDFVNCFDGSIFVNESYQPGGTITTESTITLASGAADDVGAFSHKMVSQATTIDKFVNTLNSFWMDVENVIVTGSKTATVEVISATALNNDELSLQLEYMGTSGSSFASFVDNFVATSLTAAAAVASSTANWNSTPGSPSFKQKLEVTFAPLVAGRLRARVRLGKASTTVYVNPQVVVT